jgi:hypothetical protein
MSPLAINQSVNLTSVAMNFIEISWLQVCVAGHAQWVPDQPGRITRAINAAPQRHGGSTTMLAQSLV